jgi:hypothetical protein
MYKAGSEFKDEMLKCGNGSPEWLDWITQHCCLRYFVHNVGCSSQQWFEGKMKPFSVVFYIVGPDMIESTCFWSVSGVTGDESLSLLLTTTLSLEILYIMTRHASLRRSSRLHHLSCCSMSPTLNVLCCLLVTYLAALRWTISILLMSDLR